MLRLIAMPRLMLGANRSVSVICSPARGLILRTFVTRLYANATKKGVDLPYVPETARILLAMSQAAAELVNTGDVTPAQEKIQEMIVWFDNHLVSGVETAKATRRKP
ncbi:hypothetical protein [Agrobacterium tumefaciens]|uniref:hypothetical protein n=1 Tax=Agrobacterium tumefaciens TaxID=358 RepID=UPI001FD9A5F8|nr:hypothetical protein [Agrobacterium tumefaciens]MBP2535863.1 hypothetical protein [Agrobacterium tumefaciens]